MNFEALAKQIGTIQHTLQAQAAHAVNLALTARSPYREELADRVLYSGVRAERRGQGGIRGTVAEETGVKVEYKGIDCPEISGIQTVVSGISST